MPLREELAGIGERILAYFETGGDPPFILYQYRLVDQFRVCLDFDELFRWLEAPPREIACRSVSLSRLFWRALEESGYLDELFDFERRAMDAAEASGKDIEHERGIMLEKITVREMHTIWEAHEAVGEMLRQSPTLIERVIEVVAGFDGPTAVFLDNTRVLYLSYCPATMLDELKGRRNPPVGATDRP